jgi:hypothetical protein
MQLAGLDAQPFAHIRIAFALRVARQGLRLRAGKPDGTPFLADIAMLRFLGRNDIRFAQVGSIGYSAGKIQAGHLSSSYCLVDSAY